MSFIFNVVYFATILAVCIILSDSTETNLTACEFLHCSKNSRYPYGSYFVCTDIQDCITTCVSMKASYTSVFLDADSRLKASCNWKKPPLTKYSAGCKNICSMNLTCRYCGNPEFTAVYHSTKIMDGAGDCKTFHKSDNEYIFNISLASSRAVATMPQTTAGLRTSNKSTASRTKPLSSLTFVSRAIETTALATHLTDRVVKCQCNRTDDYGTQWTIESNRTKTTDCHIRATGEAQWSCILIKDECKTSTKTPEFSNCTSVELTHIECDIERKFAEKFENLLCIWKQLMSFANRSTYFGHEIHRILCCIQKLLYLQISSELELQLQTIRIGVSILNTIIVNYKQWEQIPPENRTRVMLLLMNVSEEMSFQLSNTSQSRNVSFSCEIKNHAIIIYSIFWNGSDRKIIQCGMETEREISGGYQSFPSERVKSRSFIMLPWPKQTFSGAGLIIDHASMMEYLLPGKNNIKADVWKTINGPVMSYKYFGDDDLQRSSLLGGDEIILVFRHKVEAKTPARVRTVRRFLRPNEPNSAVLGSSFCVYLNYSIFLSADKELSWKWDDYGCWLKETNRTHTVCACNHLTGFNNLMDFHNYTGESKGLEIATYICCSSSVIALAVTFSILTAFKSIKTDRTNITRRLCAWLMLAHLLSVTTMERNNFHLDESSCAAMGILLHFCLLTSFTWMGIEGLHLCRMAIIVFNVKNWTRIYTAIGYGVPTIVVSTTILTAYFTTGVVPAYVDDESCWLVGENYKWGYAGPIAVIIIGNMVAIGVAVYFTWNLTTNSTKSTAQKIRQTAGMSISLTFLFGVSWISGYLFYTEIELFAYLFTITNGLQGVLILLFQCVLNQDVRSVFRDKWKRYLVKQDAVQKSSNKTKIKTTERVGRDKPLVQPQDDFGSWVQFLDTTEEIEVVRSETKVHYITHYVAVERPVPRPCLPSQFSELPVEQLY